MNTQLTQMGFIETGFTFRTGRTIFRAMRQPGSLLTRSLAYYRPAETEVASRRRSYIQTRTQTGIYHGFIDHESQIH